MNNELLGTNEGDNKDNIDLKPKENQENSEKETPKEINNTTLEKPKNVGWDIKSYLKESFLSDKFSIEQILVDFDNIQIPRRELVPSPKPLTKSTNEKTLFSKVDGNEKWKNDIFLANKRGRKPKYFNYENVDIEAEKIHTKDEYYNIGKKMKRHLVEITREFLNEKLKESENPHLNSLQLLKIDSSKITVDTKDENLELLKKI